MRPFAVKPSPHLKGQIFLPGDKSIAHRCIILGSISRGKTTIENFPFNKDCLSTLQAFTRMGVEIKKLSTSAKRTAGVVSVYGKGLRGLRRPASPLFIEESGTTLRLLLGVLAGQRFSVTLLAGKPLSGRPMLRVTEPLRLMGAKITARLSNSRTPGFTDPLTKKEEYPPITVSGGALKPITYNMPVASAQVKSAILLAGLYSEGKTEVIEPVPTRDHTERILRLFGADIKNIKNGIAIRGGKELISPGKINVPGDISSAAFFMVLAAITEDSSLTIRNVNLNPTRMGAVEVLKRMGANLKVTTHHSPLASAEPSGDVEVNSSTLKGTVVKKNEIPSLIDELPILMVAASVAEGETVFEGAGELRVKETDRIESMSLNLKKMGAVVLISKAGRQENIVIRGVGQLKGGEVKSFSDHRTAMSMIIAGIAAEGDTFVDDVSCIDKSFPGFLNILKFLQS